MPQSLVTNNIHIVFGTKYRQPFIDIHIESKLYAYICGICKQLDSPPIIIGGHMDHIHILCGLSKKLPLMTLVQKIKTGSSKWMKTQGKTYAQFR